MCVSVVFAPILPFPALASSDSHSIRQPNQLNLNHARTYTHTPATAPRWKISQGMAAVIVPDRLVVCIISTPWR